MSKPNTRNKNKRQRTEDGEDSSIGILRKIHLTGEICQNDVRQLYLVWKPICDGCRGNSKDSPNCFCGFIPPPNGTRKVGLWQRMPDIIQSLGPNPCKDLRSSTDTPAGLTNLGATCYANSILQCLYMNTAFRAGIFSVEPGVLEQHPVLDQLARLFVQLHSSKMAFIDSAPFIKTLELDNGVQQDSHEFLTLFLSLLERSLSHSRISNAKTVVQDLFRGRVSHVTRCSACGKDSDASLKMEDFYELELNIKGLNSLDESLNDYLSLENLDGENQYFCESCGKRVDATRNIKLRSLPLVLNFQLKRYVFLPKTTTKKKITSTFHFPRRLNMAKRLCSSSESEFVYELSAILIHKGTAVNSGHYVAHIKDEYTGHWWEFDDEHVSKLGFHPFGEVSTAKADKIVTLDGSEHVKPVQNGNHVETSKAPTICNSTSNEEEVFASSDAYMLMYTCVNVNDSARSNRTSKVTDIEADLSNTSLPVHLKKEIEELNASYDQACGEYQQRKDEQVSHITQRRQEVKSILSEAPVHSGEDSYFWISTDWLRLWADSITPPHLDNTLIQCSHGKVSFSKVACMKRLSNTAWHKLLSKYGGGPALTGDDYCIECLKDAARRAVCADDYRDRRASLRHVAEAALTGNHSDNPSYLVSKTWLVQWLRRKNVDNPCDADAGPTSSLRCPHGDLLPEQVTGAKRVSVPEVLWLFLFESASKVKPDDLVLAFPSDSRPCPTCTSELTEVACLEDSLRATKLKQRQNHEKLLNGKSFTLYLDCKYFLIPSSWLAKWRAFVTATGKNKSSSVEPDSLQVIIDTLICEKHSRLLERPLELICKRGIISQRISATEGLTLISESDWKLFCEEWNAIEYKGILAEIYFTNSSSSEVTGSCAEMPELDKDSEHSNGEANSDLEDRRPFVRTFPEVCDDCLGERACCELMQKLNYSNEDICVYLVRGKEAPRSIIEASGTVPEPDRRTSKRSRKTSFGNSITLKVSGNTSIYQLKMMIWEAFGVVKENQKIHKGSAEVEGDSATLADKNIFPGDVLWVKDLEIHESRDIADEFTEQKMEPQQVEEGFRGTLLTSDVLPQVFQESPST